MHHYFNQCLTVPQKSTMCSNIFKLYYSTKLDLKKENMPDMNIQKNSYYETKLSNTEHVQN